MAQLGRSQPFRPHLAPSRVVAPGGVVIAGSTRVSVADRRSFEQRGAPHPHLPPPIPPSALAVTIVQGETLTLVAVTKPPTGSRFPPRRPLYAKPLLFVPGSPVQGLTSVAADPPHRWYVRIPRPHLAQPIPPPGGNPLPINSRTGLFAPQRIRTNRLSPPSALVQFSTPVIASATVKLQALFRTLIGRTTPHPHVALGVVAPGGPVIPAATVLMVTNAKRSTVQRGAPHPHVAPANLTQPAPTSPLPPAYFVSQSKRRPYVGRTTPRPHYTRPNLTPPPFPPGRNISQSERRTHIGRTTPKPHATGPVVTPFVAGATPLPPAIVISQARARALRARKNVAVIHASPLSAVPPSPNLVAFAAEMSTARWQAWVAEQRWLSAMRQARWTAQTGTARWESNA